MYHRISSCHLFAEGRCPEQHLVEKMCLIPQFMTAEEYEKIRNNRCCLKDLVVLDDSLKALEQQTRREAPRVLVSCSVNLQQSDSNQVGGEIYDLSTGGIGIKTNYPITKRGRLTLAFRLPDTVGLIRTEGEVVWRQIHGDTPGHEGKSFTAGIRFLSFGEPSRKALRDYLSISNPP